MNGRSRRRIEMGKRAFAWSIAHQEESPGYAAALSRLKDLLSRADQLAAQQRDGILESRRAIARKRELRQEMKQAHLPHLIQVARAASEEEPKLSEKFAMPGRLTTYAAFRTALGGIAAEAESRKDLLVKYGLSESLLKNLRESLEEFDAVTEQGSTARATHVGASAEQQNVANEIIQVVSVMDGLNRFRFARNRELLSGWQSASNVVATPRAEDETGSAGELEASQPPASGGDIRPAA